LAADLAAAKASWLEEPTTKFSKVYDVFKSVEVVLGVGAGGFVTVFFTLEPVD
jgi:hypothetical protein